MVAPMFRLRAPIAIGLFFAASSVSAQAPPVEAALFEKLRASLLKVDAGLDGVLGVAVKDLSTGRVVDVRGDVVFPQASSIKLALIYELYQQAAAGKVDLNAIRSLPKTRAGGSGVLPFLSEKAQFTVRDLAVLMMTLSDNAATNILIDEVGGFAAVNARMDALGLPKTRLRRKMIDIAAARRGEENVSTPLEMMKLIEIILKAPDLPAELANDLRTVVGLPKSNAFRLPLPGDLTVLDKAGDLEGVRTSTGLVVLKHRPYAVAAMTTALRNEADGESAIREISLLAYELFARLDKASPEGRLLGR
jgi:beta-lactamase class A